MEVILLELELSLYCSVVGRCGSAIDAIGRQHKLRYTRAEAFDRSKYANARAFGRPIIEKMSGQSKAQKSRNIRLPENVMLADAPAIPVSVEVPS